VLNKIMIVQPMLITTLGEQIFKAIYKAQIPDEEKLRTVEDYTLLCCNLIEPYKYFYSLLSYFMVHQNIDFERDTLNFLITFQTKRTKGTAALFNEGIFALILYNTQFPVIA